MTDAATAAAQPQQKTSVPWVEKYRPIEITEIVLDPLNRVFFQNMIGRANFPNLLFYGPPGTGKTTTIISLINQYHKNARNRGLVLHLNASDDRGIDVIRNQINQFVNARTMFERGTKFVILDEVDYMTKNAQQALRYLIQENYHAPVRFCLICNYISKIEYSLKNEFICIRFNQLPPAEICQFIYKIARAENLEISDVVVQSLQRRFQSDIRSMINFLQTNAAAAATAAVIHDISIIDETILRRILQLFSTEPTDAGEIRRTLYKTSIEYNVDEKELMKHCFQYIIRTRAETMGATEFREFLSFVETILHNNCDGYIDYLIYVGNLR